MCYDEAVRRKKKIAFRLLFAVSAMTCFLCAWGAYSIAMNSKPKTVVLDLSKFSGRVFQEGEIKPGTFTVDAPLEEAVRWGSDAILSYGPNGVKIWRPDHATAGVFQYSLLGNSRAGDGGYSYETNLEGRRLVVKSNLAEASWVLIGMVGFIGLVLSLAIGAGTINQKYP